MLLKDFEVINVVENEIEERVKALACYIIETGSTVRAAANKFNVSKSTVHTDVGELQFFKIPRFIVLPTGLARCGEPRVKLAVKV